MQGRTCSVYVNVYLKKEEKIKDKKEEHPRLNRSEKQKIQNKTSSIHNRGKVIIHISIYNNTNTFSRDCWELQLYKDNNIKL